MLSELAGVITRHVTLIVVLLLASLGIGVVGFLAAPAKYESSGQVLFLPPITDSADGPINPFMQLGSSLLQTSYIVGLSATDTRSSASVEAKFGQVEYTVMPNYAENAGPTVFVTAIAGSPSAASDTVDFVAKMLASRLAELQTSSKVPKDLWISSTVLIAPDAGARIYEIPIRLAVIGFVVSVLLGALLVITLDRRQLRRSQRLLAHPPLKNGEVAVDDRMLDYIPS